MLSRERFHGRSYDPDTLRSIAIGGTCWHIFDVSRINGYSSTVYEARRRRRDEEPGEHLISKTTEDDEDGACRQRVGLVETRGTVRRMRSNGHRTRVHARFSNIVEPNSFDRPEIFGRDEETLEGYKRNRTRTHGRPPNGHGETHVHRPQTDGHRRHAIPTIERHAPRRTYASQ